MGGFSIRPSGHQTATQADVDRFLQETREMAGRGNPQVLGIHQIPIMRAKRNGYPVDMYHEKFEMRQAFKVEEEQALASMGYQREYIRKDYPKALFRRNMDSKFEPIFDEGGVQLTHAFIQQITCRDAEHEAALRKAKPKAGQSEWYAKITDIPELPDAPSEDPAVTIARLEGELSAMKGNSEESGNRRKKKEEPVAA